MTGDTGTCGRCGRIRPLKARELCSTCHDICRRYGGLAEYGWVRADRLAEFRVLRERRYPVEMAGARVGVSASTAWRYEAALKQARAAA